MARGWTNAVLRKHLGERGYTEVGRVEVAEGTTSQWKRNDEELVLVEYNSDQEPIIYFNGIAIDPNDIGWMNVNIQEQAYREQAANAARERREEPNV